MANNNPETLAKLYGLFLYKKKDIIAIQEKLGIGPGNANELVVPPDSELIRKTLANSNKASTDISLGEIFNLLMYLEDDIIEIQEELGIVGYSNQERAEEADKMQEHIFKSLRNFTAP
ncbi:hypothetical protein C1646_773644 [Rhizophagus diaphanus]|nr:hypothetical protein C1646_773644 [Rhizophagus diaphanus] [Rhizophagus sp. MUCL 43196]